jgi:hypothetical protein
LEYSPDGGLSWTLLGFDLQETSLTINTSDLPGGNNAMIRLLASDGLNTGEDFPDGLISVASKPPQVYIANPQEATTIIEGWPVIMHAYGTDLEDGPLPAATAFEWSSDRDGDMGSGEWLIASSENMSVGSHIITLAGIDSDGQSATYTTKITITEGYHHDESKRGISLWIIILAAVIVASVILVIVLVLIHRRRKNH